MPAPHTPTPHTPTPNTPDQAPPPIFDAALARARLARARSSQARSLTSLGAGPPADFLLTRVVADILERLETIQRDFRLVADCGTPAPALAAALAARDPRAEIVRVAPLPEPASVSGSAVVGDCSHLPLASGRFDLAVSALALQGVNDLPGALVQIRLALKPDGLFLGALVGGRSLIELRTVLTQAEAALSGGASPRVAPFADVRDCGGLLQRAGFALPVADSDVFTVRYASLFQLLADLRAMGATSALVDRARRPATRALFARAAALYAERYADPDGRIRATFEIISLSGWSPDPSQQKPAKRGSATVSLKDVLGHKD